MPTARDKPDPPARDDRIQPAPTKRRVSRRRITQTDVGSLYDILHDHAGTALFVVPIGWTDRHTDLLV